MSVTYYWKQVYEIDADEVHWALCDSDSAKEGLVTDHCMVLHSHYPTCCDGQPLSEQPVPKRIVELLNRYGLHDKPKESDRGGSDPSFRIRPTHE